MTGPAGPLLGVLGDLLEDVVVWLDEPLRRATDTAARITRVRGGSGANVAALAAARTPTRFLGCVGADACGDQLVAELGSCGVDVRVQRRGTTGAVVVVVDPDGERSMLPDRGASRLLEGVDPAWTAGLAHLHVPAYALEGGPTAGTAAGLLRAVRDAGGTTSLDASSTALVAGLGPSRVRELVADLRPTVLFANRAEAELLGVDPGGAGRAAGPTGLGEVVVVVKDGGDPTTVLAPGEAPLRVPVPPVAVVRDLTGAGDAFAAGYLAAVLGGAGALAACRAGHAAAAAVLASPGAGGALTR